MRSPCKHGTHACRHIELPTATLLLLHCLAKPLGACYRCTHPVTPYYPCRTGPPSSVVLKTTYVDERVRLGKGSRGSLFVFTRGGAADAAGGGARRAGAEGCAQHRSRCGRVIHFWLLALAP